MTVVKIPSEFVGAQIVSCRLPPVSRRSCQRVIPFEGKRNGGLDFSQSRRKNVQARENTSAVRRLFSFAVVQQNGQSLLFIDGLLFFLLGLLSPFMLSDVCSKSEPSTTGKQAFQSPL